VGIGEVWNLIAMKPMINVSIVMSSYLAGSFGLTIIVLTLIVRLVTLPLTLKQLRSTKAMQALQPQLAELQKKYAKDKQKLAQEQMRMYKESGMSPAGCLVPLLVQMPVWIALYQAIMKILAVTPEDFLGLAQYLYSWPLVYSTVPLGSSFLWLDLATPDRLIILPILVGGSMWITQKMVTPLTTDPRQQAQSKMMLWMMPLMFAFLTLQFPSGLALYWVISNIITIGIQYYVVGGWGGLTTAKAAKPRGRATKYQRRVAEIEKAPSTDIDTGADIVEPSSTEEERFGYGGTGDKRQDRGGGYPARPRPVRHQPRRGGSHRPKRR